MDRKYLPVVSLLILTVLVFGIWMLFEGQGEEESRVNWLYNYDEGLSKAGDESKMVLIDFYADWCTWCTKLDLETYNNQDVASLLNEEFVCIKIDTEKNVGLSMNYNVHSLPTIAFLLSNGDEVRRIKGYMPPDQFLEYVRDVVDQFS